MTLIAWHAAAQITWDTSEPTRETRMVRRVDVTARICTKS